MSRSLSLFSSALAWLLAAFFLFGAYSNFFITDEYAAAYAAWGYPGWFHFVTAILELTAALLLLRAASRPYGAGLGALVMAAATLTTLVHASYDHTAAPSVVLLVALAVLVLSRRGAAGVHSPEILDFRRHSHE